MGSREWGGVGGLLEAGGGEGLHTQASSRRARPAGLFGRSQEDKPLRRAPFEDPQLEPYPVLGALLALVRLRVNEIQIADQHADPLESEGVEHRESPPSLTSAFPASSYYLPYLPSGSRPPPPPAPPP